MARIGGVARVRSWRRRGSQWRVINVAHQPLDIRYLLSVTLFGPERAHDSLLKRFKFNSL